MEPVPEVDAAEEESEDDEIAFPLTISRDIAGSNPGGSEKDAGEPNDVADDEFDQVEIPEMGAFLTENYDGRSNTVSRIELRLIQRWRTYTCLPHSCLGTPLSCMEVKSRF